MADISKISIDGGTTEYNVKDTTARNGVNTINGKIGANNGIATLNSSGKVPEGQLPSYVDDVVEGYLYNGAFYEDAQHTTPITGESGKIYVDLDTDKTYRWSGTVYVCTGSSLEIGEVTGTAFDGGRGKAIEDKIPSNASSSNKLATMDDVGDIETTEALIKTTTGWVTKNILKCDISGGTYEKNGLRYIVQTYLGEVYYISVSGTATANTLIPIASEVRDTESDTLSSGYILSGCPEGGSSSTYSLLISGDYGQEIRDYGEGASVPAGGIRNASAYIYVKNGATLNSRTFYPMLRPEAIKDSSFIPYHPSVKSVIENYFKDITDYVNNIIGWSGKNILNIPSSVVTQTIDGVTFTVNRNTDGEITSIAVNSSSNTANVTFLLASSTDITSLAANSDLFLNGCPDINSPYDYNRSVSISTQGNGKHIDDTGSGVSIERGTVFTDNLYISVYLNDASIDTVFYPMICLDSTPDKSFEPHHSSVSEMLDKKQDKTN